VQRTLPGQYSPGFNLHFMFRCGRLRTNREISLPSKAVSELVQPEDDPNKHLRKGHALTARFEVPQAFKK
jgi:hypothetical protein